MGYLEHEGHRLLAAERQQSLRDRSADADAPGSREARGGRPRRWLRRRGQETPDSAAVAALVRDAVAGDESSWEALVTRFTPAVRAAARGFRLSPADVDDVVQNTWLAAFRHIRRLEKPESFAPWLVVTARRESLRALQRGVPGILTDEPPAPAAAEADSPEAVAIGGERDRAVRAAVDRLPDHQRRLLAALLTWEDTSYAGLSHALGIPLGSIGPTRDRGLERLRRDRQLLAVLSPERDVSAEATRRSSPCPVVPAPLPQEGTQ